MNGRSVSLHAFFQHNEEPFTIPRTRTHRLTDCCLSPTRGCAAEPAALTLPPSSRLMARFEAKCPRFLCFYSG